jgi:hypothetical protein
MWRLWRLPLTGAASNRSAQEFLPRLVIVVAHAIKLCPLVIMLCRLAFLESQRRTEILDSGQLARIYLFKSRLPTMHRHNWQGPKASSAIAFSWLVWRHDHDGPAEFHRIDWRRP